MYNLLWKYAKARMKEPSTWRGLITAVTASGVLIAPQYQELIITIGVALFTALSVTPDNPQPTTEDSK